MLILLETLHVKIVLIVVHINNIATAATTGKGEKKQKTKKRRRGFPQVIRDAHFGTFLILLRLEE